MAAAPLPKDCKVTHVAWRDLKVEVVREGNVRARRHQETLHYSFLHRGRVLMSEVEGEVFSGQVPRRLTACTFISSLLAAGDSRWVRLWQDAAVAHAGRSAI